MNVKMLSTYLIDCAVLVVLASLVFGYQSVRNQERADVGYELAAFLFDTKDKATETHKAIGSVNDLLATFQSIVDAYYRLPASSTGTFMHYTYGEDNFTSVAPVVEMTFHKDPQIPFVKAPVTVLSNVPRNDMLGPLVNPRDYYRRDKICSGEDTTKTKHVLCRSSSIADLFDKLERIKLSFQLHSLRRLNDGGVCPSEWSVEVVFELGGYGPVITMYASFSSVEENSPQRLPVVLCCLMMPLLLLSVLLRMHRTSQLGKYLKAVFDAYRESQWCGRLYHPKSGSRGEVFTLFVFLSDVVTLVFSTALLAVQFAPRVSGATEHALTVLLGFATFMRSAQLISVLKLSPSLCVVVDGFVTASDQLFMYVVAVFPILFGYSLCGYIVYGSYQSYFKTVSCSIVTLICAAFGDNLIDTFVDIDQGAYIVQLIFTRIFFGSFLAFFICNVLNVAYSIIQDSYNQAIRLHTASRCNTNDLDVGTASLGTEELREMLGRLRR